MKKERIERERERKREREREKREKRNPLFFSQIQKE
jgi:hypothetical protein